MAIDDEYITREGYFPPSDHSLPVIAGFNASMEIYRSACLVVSSLPRRDRAYSRVFLASSETSSPISARLGASSLLDPRQS